MQTIRAHFGSSLSTTCCSAYRLKLLDLRIVIFASVSCIMPDNQVYVGFSLHWSRPKTFQRVLPAVRAAAAESGHSFTEFADFVYLGLKVPATQNAVNCWLKRSAFHDTKFQVCFHLDEGSAVIGLSTTMVPK